MQLSTKKGQGVMPLLWQWAKIVLFLGMVVVGTILLTKVFAPDPQAVQANITQSVRDIRGLS